MLNVHLRVNDAATARPTPVRLRISGPDGTPFPPLGRVAEFPHGRNEDVGGHLWVGKEAWYSVDGTCEVPLPAGVPLRVQATKGPEFRPLDETVTLGPGQMALRFAVERWSNVREQGWHPGDARCHFLTPHAALLEAAAEDLDVVNLLAAVQPLPSADGTAYTTTPNLTAFSGQAPALEAHGRLVAVNTLNTHPVLGKVGLLYSHRPVFPLTFGGSEPDDWSVCDWCDQCHRKGGLTVWVDAFKPAGGLTGGEALVAALLGKIDAIEVGPQPVLTWVYRLWNAGFPIPLIGGSGKDSNRTPLGAMRTYARLTANPGREAGGVNYKEWIDAVRAGRTFVTSGPLLTFDVGASNVVRASAVSLTPFEKLELVVNGEVTKTAAATQGANWSAELEFAPDADTAWVAARVVGPAAFAHTSPVRIGACPAATRQTAVRPLGVCVRAVAEWVETVGYFENPKRKQQLFDRCAEALAKCSDAP